MNTAKSAERVVLGVILSLAQMAVSAQVGAALPDERSGLSWEQIQLFYPSEALLLAESRGRVTIYDGLYQADINRAMDEQFGRIDRMMFIRTRQDVDQDTAMDEDCD